MCSAFTMIQHYGESTLLLFHPTAEKEPQLTPDQRQEGVYKSEMYACFPL